MDSSQSYSKNTSEYSYDVTVEQDGPYMLFHVDKQHHAGNLIQSLPDQLRDVWLQTENKQQVSFHSALLGAASPLLQGNQEPEITVPRVSMKTLSAVRSFLYKPHSFVEIGADWREVLDLASFLQMDHLVNGTLDLAFILDSWFSMYLQKIQTYFLVKSHDQEFPCHAAILAASSPEMAKQVLHILTGFPTPSVPSLTLTTGNPHVTKVLMEFIYSGVLKLQWEYVFELFELAVEYQFDAVQQMCMTYIVQLVCPSCSVEFYHRAQEISSRCSTVETKELVTTLHAWLSLNFAEVIRCPKSVRELTETDWLEFLSWGYLTGWQVDEVIAAAVHWYKQDVSERTLVLPRIIASITALDNKHNDRQHTESHAIRKHLEDSLSEFVTRLGDEIAIDPDDMEAHCNLFQQHQAFVENSQLSEYLHDKVTRIQEGHNICSQEVMQYAEAERQQVVECYQSFQQCHVGQEQMMQSMKELKLHQTVQSQQIDMTQQRLDALANQQQQDQQVLQHNQEVINKRNEEHQKQVQGFQQEVKKLAEATKKQEEQEQAFEKRRKEFEEQVKKQEEEEEELKKKQAEQKKMASDQEEEEKKLDKKKEELDKRTKEQEAEEKDLDDNKETLKKEREKFEQERKKLEGDKETLEQKKRRLQEELQKNAEDFKTRLEKMKADANKDKTRYDTAFKKHAEKQKELEEHIKKITKEMEDEKQKLKDRMDKFEKKK